MAADTVLKEKCVKRVFFFSSKVALMLVINL